MLRDKLQIPDLMAFDGVPEPQRIEQLEIQYQHETNPIDSLTETLVIDRLSGCFEDRIEDNSTGAIQSQRLEDGHAVRAVLDQLALEDFTEPIPGEPDDVVASPYVGRYHICVSTFDGNRLDLDGDYAQLALPPKWPQIMDALESLSKRRYSSHIFSSNEYQFRKRRADELILVRVVFDTAGRSYSYRAESDYLKVGDDVIVPVGEDGKEAFATIVGIDYLGPDEVPYDLEDLKSVIRAATPADYARFNRQIPGKP